MEIKYEKLFEQFCAQQNTMESPVELHIRPVTEKVTIAHSENIIQTLGGETQSDPIAEMDDATDYFEYFFHDYKKEHEEHQQRKQSMNNNYEELNLLLGGEELPLYNYLWDNVFHPEYRPTWANLVGELRALGFVGEPNKVGNGSTWTFRVGANNPLFAKDRNYRSATFNIHKFPGNDPIHPAYLKFFRSGFTNVFGINETRLRKILDKE